MKRTQRKHPTQDHRTVTIEMNDDEASRIILRHVLSEEDYVSASASLSWRVDDRCLYGCEITIDITEEEEK